MPETVTIKLTGGWETDNTASFLLGCLAVATHLNSAGRQVQVYQQLGGYSDTWMECNLPNNSPLLQGERVVLELIIDDRLLVLYDDAKNETPSYHYEKRLEEHRVALRRGVQWSASAWNCLPREPNTVVESTCPFPRELWQSICSYLLSWGTPACTDAYLVRIRMSYKQENPEFDVLQDAGFWNMATNGEVTSHIDAARANEGQIVRIPAPSLIVYDTERLMTSTTDFALRAATNYLQPVHNHSNHRLASCLCFAIQQNDLEKQRLIADALLRTNMEVWWPGTLEELKKAAIKAFASWTVVYPRALWWFFTRMQFHSTLKMIKMLANKDLAVAADIMHRNRRAVRDLGPPAPELSLKDYARQLTTQVPQL